MENKLKSVFYKSILVFFLSVISICSLNGQPNAGCDAEDWDLINKTNDPKSNLKGCFNLVGCYYNRNMVDSAIYFANKGLDIGIKNKDEEGIGMMKIGFYQIEVLKTDLNKALEYIIEAKQHFEKVNYTKGLVRVNLSLMQLYRKKYDYKNRSRHLSAPK